MPSHVCAPSSWSETVMEYPVRAQRSGGGAVTKASRARRRRPLVRAACSLLVAACAWPASARAETFQANPSNYESMLSGLAPGDVLELAAGTYADLLQISGLNGTAADPIVITGPESGDPAIFPADPGPCCNTIELVDTSYLVLRHLTVDSSGVDGAFGVSAKNGTSNLVHHITVEDCTFLNHDGSQQQLTEQANAPAKLNHPAPPPITQKLPQVGGRYHVVAPCAAPTWR